MNSKQAERIINAFGSCTAMYECNSSSDLLEDFARWDGTFEEWVDLRLECEGIFWEQCADAKAAGGIDHDTEGDRAWMKEVAQRVNKVAAEVALELKTKEESNG